MRTPFRLTVTLATILIAVTPQITIARTAQKTKYLSKVNAIASEIKGLSRTHASTSPSYRLQYGYQICRALNMHTTLGEIDTTIIRSRELTLNEKTYHLIMYAFAIQELCPE